VLAVSRWTDREVEKRLRERGVETVTADLSPDSDLSQLPDAGNVVYMVGAKFGSADQPARTWAVNALLPAAVARRYAGARIAAFSTGNVYPLVPVSSGGSTEDDPPEPLGDYAMSCLGRERAFEYASMEHGTRVVLLRLNYAVEMRYGVLADIARSVHAGEPVDVTTGHVNVVWQAYANEVALRALRHATSPARILNVTGPETLSVRRLAARFAEAFGVPVTYTGTEAPTALLSDASRCHGLFGYPELSVQTLVEAQADWIARGETLWGKPTKFQRRDGRF
jgi:nucleoside-diphosphate-sugar epimerase